MNRIVWIDTLKALGIIAVVVGHVVPGTLAKIIFSFHMPLFFFISGFLFKEKNEVGSYFKKKQFI